MRGLLVAFGVGLALTACVTPGGGEPGHSAPGRSDQDEAVLKTLETMARRSEARHDYARAAEQYGRLVREDPTNEGYLLAVARTQRLSGNPTEAVRILRRALARGYLEDTVPVRLEKARALLAAGVLADARQELDSLRHDAADDPAVLLLAGLLADRDGHHDAAQAAYREALRQNPDDLRAANNLALSLALSGSLTEAIALQTKTAGHFDATPQMRQNLALLYALAGNMAEAERITRALMPEDQARRVLADLNRMSGRGGAAGSAPLAGGAVLP